MLRILILPNAVEFLVYIKAVLPCPYHVDVTNCFCTKEIDWINGQGIKEVGEDVRDELTFVINGTKYAQKNSFIILYGISYSWIITVGGMC